MKAIMEKKAVNKTVICLMVENQPNVLARISSLVGRRSFNISTITASETNVSGITKITLVVNGDDENVLYQIIAQMKKLENVNEAYVLPDTNSLYRELLLVKIKATQEERSALHEMTEIYRGKVVGLNKESMIIELTGSPKKIDGFMSMLEEYDIIEVSRTGVTGMARDSSEEKHLTGI
ncbi:MAG: acetolactate synthase small subunit [Anaerotignum faecicola]